MDVENVSGVVTEIVMVLIALYAKEKGHTSPEMKDKTNQTIDKFESHYRSTNCFYMKNHNLDEKKGCQELIRSGGKILDKIIAENKDY